MKMFIFSFCEQFEKKTQNYYNFNCVTKIWDFFFLINYICFIQYKRDLRKIQIKSLYYKYLQEKKNCTKIKRIYTSLLRYFHLYPIITRKTL